MVMCYQPNSENHAYVTPQKLWEAMAAGVPVVASDLPGFRSVVPGAGCGVLVDPTDPAAIAAGITELLDRGPEGLRATGERGRAAAHATYNWEEQMRVLDGVYGRLLAGRGATREGGPA
ncbi:MAG: glycosyltransferase [Chloroflexi bacterium]|nr:glycosyltransferase [Chloroflexota bacterium]